LTTGGTYLTTVSFEVLAALVNHELIATILYSAFSIVQTNLTHGYDDFNWKKAAMF
jgi:hypothetical protein